MKSATQPPWHTRGVQPTPNEFVAWFLENDAAGRIEIAEWAIRFAAEAEACLLRHGGSSR